MYSTSQGIHIYYESHYQGCVISADQLSPEQVVIVAVPGGPGFSHTVLKPALLALSEHWPILYYDPRGTGRSSASVPEYWNLLQHAQDLAELLTQLDVRKAVFYGHSAGAHYSAQTATLIPERCLGLLAAAGIVLTKQQVFDSWIELGGDLAKRAAIDLDPEALPAFMEQVMPKYDPIARPGEHAATLEVNLEQCVHMLHGVLDTSLLALIAQADLASHFLIGQHDPIYSPDDALPVLETSACKKLSWQVMPNSGHDMLMCEPVATCQALAQFINALEQR